jgi:lipoprotein-anchoring transpeptidase ErfK/SrfK
VPFLVLAVLLQSRPAAQALGARSTLDGVTPAVGIPGMLLPSPSASVPVPAMPSVVPGRPDSPVPVAGSVPPAPPGTVAGAPRATTPTTVATAVAARPRLSGGPAARPRIVPAVGDPSVVATAAVGNVPLYEAPTAAAPFETLANPNALGASLTLLVASSQDGWVQVYVPQRPNDSTAWIPVADVTISLVDAHIVVDLTTRELTLYVNDAAAWHAPVAPGAPSSPTPTGLFYVTEVIQVTDPQSQYGPYALGLSGFSNTYQQFDGGPGQIALHGTNEPRSIGTYASNGCVRLANAAITALAQVVVPGTPVQIGY